MNESTADGPRGAETLAPALVALEALLGDPNITRAAVRAGLSQPTLSRAVARWEANLGRPLIARIGRNVELTPEGRRIARAAAESLALLRAASAGDEVEEPVRLGFQGSLGSTVVAELVTSFLRDEPSARFAHEQAPYDELVDGLSSGRLHLGILGPRPEGLEWFEIGRQSLVLVVPTHHPAARRESIALSELASEPFVALDRRFHRNTDALFEEAGYAPRVILEADTAHLVREHVAAGLGIAVLPAEAGANPRLRSIRIESELAQRPIGLVWSRRHHPVPAAVRLRRHAEELTRRYPGWADLVDG